MLADNGFLYDPTTDVWQPSAAVVAVRAINPSIGSSIPLRDRLDDWLTAAAIDLAEYIAYDQAHEAEPDAAMRAAAGRAALAVWSHYERTGRVETYSSLESRDDAQDEASTQSQHGTPPS